MRKVDPKWYARVDATASFHINIPPTLEPEFHITPTLESGNS